MPPSAASFDCFAIVIWYLAGKRANRLTGQRADGPRADGQTGHGQTGKRQRKEDITMSNVAWVTIILVVCIFCFFWMLNKYR